MAKNKKSAGKATRGPVLEEVSDLESEPAGSTGHTLETGLIFVTFVALLAGVIIAQVALKHYYGAGFFA